MYLLGSWSICNQWGKLNRYDEYKFTVNTKANALNTGYENFCITKIRVVLTDIKELLDVLDIT